MVCGQPTLFTIAPRNFLYQHLAYEGPRSLEDIHYMETERNIIIAEKHSENLLKPLLIMLECAHRTNEKPVRRPLWAKLYVVECFPRINRLPAAHASVVRLLNNEIKTGRYHAVCLTLFISELDVNFKCSERLTIFYPCVCDSELKTDRGLIPKLYRCRRLLPVINYDAMQSLLIRSEMVVFALMRYSSKFLIQNSLSSGSFVKLRIDFI